MSCPTASRFAQKSLTLARGFSAKASAEALEVVSALNAEFNPYIEADSVVTASGDFATDDISKE